MSVHETANSSVTYHQQDTGFFCGAAVAQMVLDSIGTGLLDQIALYNSNNPPVVAETGWYSPPDGLATTMQSTSPPAFANFFDLVALPSEEAISRKICWAIHQHGIAPIALVFGDAHWIVVTGYTASQAPTSSTDTSYTIESFDIHNPFPPAPGSPPPHNSGIDNCGTGGDRGIANENVVYQDPSGGAGPDYWRGTYMTGVPAGHWGGKFIAICDADPAPGTSDNPLVSEGGLVTEPDEIVDRANRGVADIGLNEREPWIASLRADPADLLLVEREDLGRPRFYYIVPFRSDDGTVPFVAQVGGHEVGAIAGSIAAPGVNTHIGQAVDRETVIRNFAGLRINVAGTSVTLRQEDLNDHLFWRPCVESLSPYWPFYRFDVGGPDGDIKVYVRIDGQLVPELHLGRGM
jgi:hypothetical protein